MVDSHSSSDSLKLRGFSLPSLLVNPIPCSVASKTLHCIAKGINSSPVWLSMLACKISSTSASISCKLKILRLDVCRSYIARSLSSFFLFLFSLDQGRKVGPDTTGSVSCADFLGLSRIPGIIRLTSSGSLDGDGGVCSLSLPHKNDFPWITR